MGHRLRGRASTDENRVIRYRPERAQQFPWRAYRVVFKSRVAWFIVARVFPYDDGFGIRLQCIEYLRIDCTPSGERINRLREEDDSLPAVSRHIACTEGLSRHLDRVFPERYLPDRAIGAYLSIGDIWAEQPCIDESFHRHRIAEIRTYPVIIPMQLGSPAIRRHEVYSGIVRV